MEKRLRDFVELKYPSKIANIALNLWKNKYAVRRSGQTLLI